MRFLKTLLLIIPIWLIAEVSLAAGSATMSLAPVSKPVEVGKTIVVNLTISPNGSSVDTARASLSFSNSLIQATGVTLRGGLDSPSPGNSINNGSGTISWGGFTVDKPATTAGTFAAITFKAIAAGTATVQVVGAKLISNGEEVGNPSGFNQISIQVVPPGEGSDSPLKISSPTHPNQESWYQANTVQLVWNDIPGATYLWQMDHDPDTIPTQTIKEASKTLKNLKSGVWYFHLQAKLQDGKLIEPVHYRIQIDNVKPNPIEPYLDVNEDEQLTIRFATTDYHSGVASYDLRVNQEDIENAPNPYILRGLSIGENFIVVTAYDFAGNVRQGWVKFILNSDGTIRDITISDGVCKLPFGCDTNGYIIIGGIVLVPILLYLLYRKPKIVQAPVSTIPGVPVETTIEESGMNPDGTYRRTTSHTHVHSYTDTDTYVDSAPGVEPIKENKPAPPNLEKNSKKGSSKKPKKS